LIQSKALPYILFAYFFGVFGATKVFSVALLIPVAVFEGFFFALIREYCGFRKSLMFFTVYNVFSTFQFCFAGYGSGLTFLGPYNVYVLPLLLFGLTYFDALFFGYFITRWLRSSKIIERVHIRVGD
jgi:hypothetical protein